MSENASASAPEIQNTAEKKPKVIYTAEQQAIIDGLVLCQKQLAIGDREFASKYLKTYTESTWSKLRSASYGAKDSSKTFGELAVALNSIRRRIARQLKSTQGGIYHELDHCAAMFRAVKDCLEKRGENRLIPIVMPTGGGKSRFIAELESREETTLVRGNRSWSESYYCAASDILRALGETGRCRGVGEAHDRLISAMTGRAQVLAIDEGNYFGPQSIDLVKDILNETDWTVVIAMTETSWARMQRHYGEFSQLQRRIHTVFLHDGISAAQAGEFLSHCGLNGDSRAAALAVAKAANEFGAFDFIARVVERLDEHGRAPTLDDVHAAIAFVNRQLGRVK